MNIKKKTINYMPKVIINLLNLDLQIFGASLGYILGEYTPDWLMGLKHNSVIFATTAYILQKISKMTDFFCCHCGSWHACPYTYMYKKYFLKHTYWAPSVSVRSSAKEKIQMSKTHLFSWVQCSGGHRYLYGERRKTL